MCDPITIAMAAATGAAALFGNNKSGGAAAPPPPPAEVPATPASTARTPGAQVLVGDGTTANKNANSPEYTGFTEQRVAGKSLGGLGKGGLGL